MIRKFRLIPTKTSLFNCGVYNGILNYIIKIFKLSKFNGCYLIKLFNLKIKFILVLPTLFCSFNLLMLDVDLFSIYSSSRLFEDIIKDLNTIENTIKDLNIIEDAIKDLNTIEDNVKSLILYKDYWLNWRTPSREYIYSNFNNLELDQIHKYFENINIKPTVRFGEVTVYEIIPENYFYSESESEAEADSLIKGIKMI